MRGSRFCLAAVGLVLLISIVSFGSSEAFPGCPGTTTNQPIYSAPPKFIKAVPNGKLYQATDVSPPLSIVHVYGTPYQMGYAQGQLLKEEISAIFPAMLNWIYSQLDAYLEYLPEVLRKIIEEYGVEAALEATMMFTEPWTPQHFLDELRGIADAVPGADYSTLYRINLFPELIRAQCSMFGAWGKAIANTNGTLYQLRSLDWAATGPMQQYPVVVVYHPSSGNGHPFSTVGWAGFIGAITGFSSAPMGLSQKAGNLWNHTQNLFGIPFSFLLRDILQYDVDVAAATQRMETASRTCATYIGLGDYTNRFTAFSYSYDEVKIWDERTQPAYKDHPVFPGIVYIDKHPQPSYHPCLGDLLSSYYGKIDPPAIMNIASLGQTGDMQIAIYDYAQQWMYISNPTPEPNVIPAWSRPYVRLDMAAMFNQTL